MDQLCDDVLIEILKRVNSYELFRFSLTSRYFQSFFKRNIKYFEFDLYKSKITDRGLE